MSTASFINGIINGVKGSLSFVVNGPSVSNRISVEDLKEIVREVFQEEIQNLKISNLECKSKDEIIPLKEVSKILGISLATLNRLNKNKILINFKIGHKVFYKREDVFNRKSENNN